MASHKRRKKDDKRATCEKFSIENMTYNDIPASVLQKLNKLFQKKFEYMKAGGCYELPHVANINKATYSWEIKELQEFKVRLNGVKSRLSDFEVLSWHEHTQKTNLAGFVISHIRRSFHPELCTQAWCKFYEIVNSFDIVPLNTTLNSVHLCEAPGAFVTSLNHYLKLKRPDIGWKWVASTLNPYYEGNNLHEMIDDDRFLFNSLENWCFGADDTGDITYLENMKHLALRSKALGPVKLVTADGSIDCQDNPGEQESMVSHLHYAETITAMHILEREGSFVLKMFTMFENATVSLMYLLNCFFSKVHVFKPGTSKAGNSEVYIVCLNFLGISESFLQELTDKIGKKDLFLQRDIIPEYFLRSHVSCCEQFLQYQIDAIEQNISWYKDASQQLYEELDNDRKWCCVKYVHHYGLENLKKEQKLVPHSKRQQIMFSEWMQNAQYSRKRHCGSYTERKDQASCSWDVRLQNLPQIPVTPLQGVWWHQIPDDLPEFDLLESEPVIGKSVHQIFSSKFIYHETVNVLNELVHNANCLQEKTDVRKIGLDNSAWEEVFFHLVKEVEDQRIHLITSCEKCDHDTFISNLAVLLHTKNYRISMLPIQNISSASTEEITPGPAGRTGIGVYHINLSQYCLKDIVTRPGSNGDDYGLTLLKVLVQILQKMNIGDHLIVDVWAFLTRFQCGILFCLYNLFNWIGLVHNGSQIADPAQMVFVSLKKVRSSYQTLLSKSLEKINQLQKDMYRPTYSLLQFVPIYCLYEPNFCSQVLEWNHWMVNDRINKIIEEELQVHHKDLNSD